MALLGIGRPAQGHRPLAVDANALGFLTLRDQPRGLVEQIDALIIDGAGLIARPRYASAFCSLKRMIEDSGRLATTRKQSNAQTEESELHFSNWNQVVIWSHADEALMQGTIAG